MFQRLRSMLIKEFIQLFRDPRLRNILLIVPVLQTILFGYAVTLDVTNISTAIFDLDNSQTSRQVIASFAHSPYFKIVAYVNTQQAAQNLLDKGSAQLVVHMDHGFEALVQKGQSAPLQLLVDGSEANTGGIILTYSREIVQKIANSLLEPRLINLDKSKEPIDLRSRAWFNENLLSRNFFVPGIIGTILTLVTLTLTSMAIVREKEIGTIEQIIVSPMTSFEFILGKVIPFVFLGFVDVVLVLLVSVFWFEVPIRGSLFLLFVSSGLYLLSTLGIGLIVSSISNTQQQAMMSAFFFFLPASMLSGFIFPIANMPTVIQWFTYLNPLRYFLDIIRGIFLKGIGFKILWPNILALAVIGILTLWQATQRFKKTLS